MRRLKKLWIAPILLLIAIVAFAAWDVPGPVEAFTLLASQPGGGETSPTILTPDAAGLSTSGTGTGCSDLWDCLTDSSDATYVTLNAGTYQYISFTSTDTVPEGVTIDRVEVHARMKMADTGDDVNLNLGSNYRAGVTESATYIDYDSYTSDSKWTTNPVDSQAFEKADIDALEFGAGVRTPHAGAIDIAEMWVEVHWH